MMVTDIKSIHPDYTFVQKGLKTSGDVKDIIEYFSKNKDLYDLQNNFKSLLDLYQGNDVIVENLRIDSLRANKSDSEIWSDLGIINSKPAILIERIILASSLKLERPIIIGYLEDCAIWIYRSMLPGKTGVGILSANRIWNSGMYILSLDFT